MEKTAAQRYDDIRSLMADLRDDMAYGRISFRITDAVDVQSAILNLEMEDRIADEELARRVQETHKATR